MQGRILQILINAVINNDLVTLNHLLSGDYKKEAEEQATYKNNLALHLAARIGNLEIVKILSALPKVKEIEINNFSKDYIEIALFAVDRSKHKEIFDLLLSMMPKNTHKIISLACSNNEKPKFNWLNNPERFDRRLYSMQVFASVTGYKFEDSSKLIELAEQITAEAALPKPIKAARKKAEDAFQKVMLDTLDEYLLERSSETKTEREQIEFTDLINNIKKHGINEDLSHRITGKIAEKMFEQFGDAYNNDKNNKNFQDLINFATSVDANDINPSLLDLNKFITPKPK